jgi:hypothetical protein
VKNRPLDVPSFWFNPPFQLPVWNRFVAPFVLIAFSAVQSGQAQLSKANQILLTRGLQIQGLVSTYDTFHLTTLSNANYTTVNWLWASPRSYDGSMPLLGSAPGFPWARWVADETDMPPLGDEASYTNQLVLLQLSDEPNLDDASVRARFATWLNSVRSNWPNTILSVNDGGGINDGNLIDFVNNARPDMITFDVYPWKSVYDTNQPNHIGAPISGPPTTWYSVLRIHRDISHAFGIPFGSYVQTFHAVEEYPPYNVYRDPSPSELRLHHSGGLAFDAKLFIDFHYNNGSSSLFTAPGGDSNPNALYYEKADCALRCRNFGKALVRLKPVPEGTTPCGPLTTSVMFIRGRNSSGALNPIPLNFCAGSGTNPYTDWAPNRNDPYLRGWAVANTGTKNNGQPGDVLISWFRPLDESFDGPDYTNETYVMVVNGLTDPTGTAADCSQRITLNFASNLTAIEILNPLTGLAEVQLLPLSNGSRQLVLNLNGGDAALFKFSDGAPFIGTTLTGPPAITSQPVGQIVLFGSNATFTAQAAGAAPLSYQWKFNGTNIPSATSTSFTRTNSQAADAGNYTFVASNSFGVVTSIIATLSVVTNLPPPPPPPPLLYEPFDYPNIAGPVSSNTPANWAYGGSGANDFNVASGNLSWPGLSLPIGNSATNGGAGLGVRRLIGTSFSSGSVYFSGLFRINELGFGAWNGVSSQVGALTAPDSTTFRLQIMVKSNSPSGYVLGVRKGGTGVTDTFDTTEYHAGDTIFLVGKFDFGISPNAASLWINPNASTFGAPSAPTNGFISATTGTDGAAIDRFNFRQNVASGANSVPASMQWDELRVGTNWAMVTPPFVPVRISFVELLPDGRFRFQVSAAPGNLSIEASTNLINWIEIANLSSAYGLFEYIEPVDLGRRFFRARISQ